MKVTDWYRFWDWLDSLPQWIEYLENEGDKHVGGGSWQD